MNREQTERLQIDKLSRLLREVATLNPFYATKFGGSKWGSGSPDEPGRSLAAVLNELPFTTKEELQRSQRESPPYGTNLTYPLERYQRLHQTSGSTGQPLRWLDTRESWDWLLGCWETIYTRAGITSSDRWQGWTKW